MPGSVCFHCEKPLAPSEFEFILPGHIDAGARVCLPCLEKNDQESIWCQVKLVFLNPKRDCANHCPKACHYHPTKQKKECENQITRHYLRIRADMNRGAWIDWADKKSREPLSFSKETGEKISRRIEIRWSKPKEEAKTK